MQTRYSTIWTALYWTGDCNEGCYWIQFGQRDGPEISEETAMKLARKFLKTYVSPKMIKLNSLAEVAPGGPQRRGWKNNS